MSRTSCLACRSRHNHPLYVWQEMPLSVLGLPRSAEEARRMTRFVMDVRRCAVCGHVFHCEFDYEKIPYRESSNLMFNRSHFFGAYQEDLAREWIEAHDLEGRRVLEIGAGEGLFLRHFVEAGCACVAFEPGSDAEKCRARGVETHREYFQASRLVEQRPDAIVCRHVLEHLEDPLDFLEDIALTCQSLGVRPLFLAEVPRIDKALEQHRIHDFLWEHVSNFTERSFRTMFERAGFEVLSVEPRYEGEVVTLAARPRTGGDARAVEDASRAFRRSVDAQVRRVREVLLRWRSEGRRVAVWGGTGKGAALMNMFGLDGELISVVVDSDPLKQGGYVPGLGHRIEGPETLDRDPVDAILVASNWRARDIEHEIRRVHRRDTPLYVYHRGDLVPLTDDLEL
ncbi:MAG: class I SAM-dependent methyltransferase [Myxococcota bacterium]